MRDRRKELAAKIEHAMRQLWADRAVVELRAFGHKKWEQWSGYYKDPATFARDAASLEGKATVVYFTLNDVNPEARFRSPDRLRVLSKGDRTTSDDEITKILFLPVDLDPVRLSDTPSSDEQHQAAITRAKHIRDVLRSEGWPEPAVLDTGNGSALLFRVELAASEHELVARCLKGLDVRFSDELVMVDISVANPARIWKVPYTIAGAKGSDSAERPHRRSSLLEAPEPFKLVDPELLRDLAAVVPEEPRPGSSRQSSMTFDLEAWIASRLPGLNGPKAWRLGRKWTGTCQWNPAHTNESFFIAQFESGAIAAGCHHNGCHGRGWADLRALLEPSPGDGHRTAEPSTVTRSLTSTRDQTAKRPEAPVAERSRSAADALDSYLTTVRKWQFLPDTRAAKFAVAVIVANHHDGDPIWGLVVGASGSGKTETIMPMAVLPNVHLVSTLTEAALLSGTPKKNTAQGAKGGLLRAIGEFGVLLCKDFTSVLSMHRDARAAVLSALREIYDGRWDRHIGTDGGRTLTWRGRIGFLGACTPIIDTHHSVMSTMGERFVLYRMPKVDNRELARAAIRNSRRSATMRAEIGDAARRLFEAIDLTTLPAAVTDPDENRLIALASFVAQARSPVERDGQRREIELVPDAEAPTRIGIVLTRLLGGLRTIGVDDETAWDVLAKVGIDCLPVIRAKCLAAVSGEKASTTSDIATIIGYPTVTSRRALEDLGVHGLLKRDSGGQGRPDVWRLSELGLTLTTEAFGDGKLPIEPRSGDSPARSTFSETSGTDESKRGCVSPSNSSSSTNDDFSETVAPDELQPRLMRPEDWSDIDRLIVGD